MVLTGITSLGRYNKSKPWITSVDESIYESIRPEREIDEKTIIAIRSRKEKLLATQKEKKTKLVGVVFSSCLIVDSRLCTCY